SLEAHTDLMMDPFADPAPVELQASEPPVVDAAPAASWPDAPVAESAVHDDGVDSLFGDFAPPEPAPPFVTETMAELYLQQGFTAEALDVYRPLSAAYPDDENLKGRVRRLVRGDRMSIPLDVVPGPVPVPVPVPEPVPEPAPEPEAVPEPEAESAPL